LTTKKGPWCGAVLLRCGAVFVDLFHFLLLFVTFFIVCNFYKLLFIAKTWVKFVTFCYFFLLFVTFINYFLLLKRARVKGSIHCARGEFGWVQVDFFLFFLLLKGRGLEVNVFFPRYMKRWKEEGGKGYI